MHLNLAERVSCSYGLLDYEFKALGNRLLLELYIVGTWRAIFGSNPVQRRFCGMVVWWHANQIQNKEQPQQMAGSQLALLRLLWV